MAHVRESIEHVSCIHCHLYRNHFVRYILCGHTDKCGCVNLCVCTQFQCHGLQWLLWTQRQCDELDVCCVQLGLHLKSQFVCWWYLLWLYFYVFHFDYFMQWLQFHSAEMHILRSRSMITFGLLTYMYIHQQSVQWNAVHCLDLLVVTLLNARYTCYASLRLLYLCFA